MRTFFTYLLICLSGIVRSQEFTRSLNKGWSFHMQDSVLWMPASVPGCVHTDLYNNKRIPDPYFGNNEKQLQWIENKTWEYQSSFDLDKDLSACTSLELLFEGLDTYADVYLNNIKILSSENMFRAYRVQIKPYVKENGNTLKIIFYPAIKRSKTAARQLPYTLPGEERVFVRKAQYQFGWDWAPRFVTCGIWKNVSLIGFKSARILHVKNTCEIQSEKKATVHFSVTTEALQVGTYTLCVLNKQKVVLASQSLNLSSGGNTHTLDITISNPKLWWCNGMGAPNLYDYHIELRKGNQVLSKQEQQIGLRKIELRQQKDSIGTSFTFVLNGKPVFVRGANYVPSNIFPSNPNKDDHKELILMARSSNMNMLRIWGGGIYPDEHFLEACDRNGIMIWQDFMFACAMYPGDRSFLQNVKEEVRENIQRIEQHPCLALWCGNNENDEGWHNWGWQQQYKYSAKDSTEIWQNYKQLFHQLIPELLKEQHSEVSYWPSSPSIGWGRKESLTEGDSHYWGVWWGNEPFEMYRNKTGRFMSEYGFQGMPSYYNFKRSMNFSNSKPDSSDYKNHQKHPTGYETILNYMRSAHTVPSDFEKLIYASQVLQRKGMQTAILSHRSGKPDCMGTLFWQLNDCWPGTSWSAIDYYKHPKALYYSLPKLYNNFVVDLRVTTDAYCFDLINDSIHSLKGDLNITYKTFDGKTQFIKQVNAITVSHDHIYRYRLPKDPANSYGMTPGYFVVEFVHPSYKKRSLHFLTDLAHNALPKPEFSIVRKGAYFQITAKTFVKDLYISIDDGECILSENFFDLEAGETKTIKVISLIKNPKTLKTFTYYELLHP